MKIWIGPKAVRSMLFYISFVSSYLILFTRLLLTLIHVLVGEPREVQTQTQPLWSLCGTTKVWRVSPNVSRTRLVFTFLLCYVIFVMLARTLHMSVYSFHGFTYVLDDPVCTELKLLYFCCELLMYMCLVVWMCHVSTALRTKFWTASVWPPLTLLTYIRFGLRP